MDCSTFSTLRNAQVVLANYFHYLNQVEMEGSILKEPLHH
ncbi:hypothetical protein ADICYQ_3401 [Cyclobacterium qasimii M12-11B]|uniref:Uncharacterized protein n=1 Tax=Cyclobacterium qasimii M12-11B TaxID=641524 RepID=S7WU29_9BACT|nr:hypothetical protein ADICYQ_3401 [Cyclobacterium qasimii M12-11B]